MCQDMIFLRRWKISFYYRKLSEIQGFLPMRNNHPPTHVKIPILSSLGRVKISNGLHAITSAAMFGTSSGLPRKSCRHLRKFSEMIGNVRTTFGQYLENFQKSSENILNFRNYSWRGVIDSALSCHIGTCKFMHPYFSFTGLIG